MTLNFILSPFVFVFYLPRGFPQIFITLMYIHLNANADTATQSIAADVPGFVGGDFCSLTFIDMSLVLPGI